MADQMFRGTSSSDQNRNCWVKHLDEGEKSRGSLEAETRRLCFPCPLFLLSLSLSWSFRVILVWAKFNIGPNIHRGPNPSPVPKQTIPFALWAALKASSWESQTHHSAFTGTEKKRGTRKGRGHSDLAMSQKSAFTRYPDTRPTWLSSLEFLPERRWKVRLTSSQFHLNWLCTVFILLQFVYPSNPITLCPSAILQNLQLSDATLLCFPALF